MIAARTCTAISWSWCAKNFQVSTSASGSWTFLGFRKPVNGNQKPGNVKLGNLFSTVYTSIRFAQILLVLQVASFRRLPSFRENGHKFPSSTIFGGFWGLRNFGKLICSIVDGFSELEIDRRLNFPVKFLVKSCIMGYQKVLVRRPALAGGLIARHFSPRDNQWLSSRDRLRSRCCPGQCLMRIKPSTAVLRLVSQNLGSFLLSQMLRCFWQNTTGSGGHVEYLISF